MEVKGQHAYAQPVETVFKSFGDKARLQARFTALGARNIQIETCKLTKTSLDTNGKRGQARINEIGARAHYKIHSCLYTFHERYSQILF